MQDDGDEVNNDDEVNNSLILSTSIVTLDEVKKTVGSKSGRSRRGRWPS